MFSNSLGRPVNAVTVKVMGYTSSTAHSDFVQCLQHDFSETGSIHSHAETPLAWVYVKNVCVYRYIYIIYTHIYEMSPGWCVFAVLLLVSQPLMGFVQC